MKRLVVFLPANIFSSNSHIDIHSHVCSLTQSLQSPHDLSQSQHTPPLLRLAICIVEILLLFAVGELFTDVTCEFSERLVVASNVAHSTSANILD